MTEDTQPSIAERVAAVERLAEQAGITLTEWQRQAIEVMYAGGVVTRGRRNGWTTIRGLMQAEHEQRASYRPGADRVTVPDLAERIAEYAAAHEPADRPGWLSRWFRRHR